MDRYHDGWVPGPTIITILSAWRDRYHVRRYGHSLPRAGFTGARLSSSFCSDACPATITPVQRVASEANPTRVLSIDRTQGALTVAGRRAGGGARLIPVPRDGQAQRAGSMAVLVPKRSGGERSEAPRSEGTNTASRSSSPPRLRTDAACARTC